VFIFTIARQKEAEMANPARYPGAPRWVKVFGIAVGAVALLVVIVLHAGGGPRHNILSAGGFGDRAASKGSR
jgi:hypothetical protein